MVFSREHLRLGDDSETEATSITKFLLQLGMLLEEEGPGKERTTAQWRKDLMARTFPLSQSSAVM